jgi:hypothetical protein
MRKGTLSRESIPDLIEGSIRAAPEGFLSKVGLGDGLEGREGVVGGERGGDVGGYEPLVRRESLELQNAAN